MMIEGLFAPLSQVIMKKPILTVSSISKSFNSQQALDDVSLDIFPGEIVGLVGANGAGKSTLLKIISGSLSPDAGSIYFNGEKIEAYSPRLAMGKGIISVYQDLNLFSNMSVAENIFLDSGKLTKFGTVNWNATKEAAQEILSKNNLDIRADTLISNLSLAKQCMLDIIRALNENPRLLLLDEPTSALCDSEIEWLYGKMREAADNNIAIIFVSHRLDEVNEICNRSVILREGKVVHISDDKVDKSTTIKYMVGHDVVLSKQKSKEMKRDIAFECYGLESENGAKADRIILRKGEILGIAGLVGSGRTELLNTIFGIDKLKRGAIKKDGKEIRIKDPFDAIKKGIILIPEDRKISGLYLEENMRFNIASSTLDKRKRFGMVNEREEIKETSQIAGQVMLDIQRMDHLVRQLSGGNQQKVVIARTLLANADVYLLDEPTRGVDIGAREEIYEIIKKMSEAGKSIILVTSDWEELIYLCDRILVMSEMEVVGELEDSFSQMSIMQKIESSNKVKNTCSENKVNIIHRLVNRYGGLRNINFLVLFIILVVTSVLGASLSPFFLRWINISNLFSQTLPLVILSLGQLIVIASGGIDLSAGALIAGSAMVGQLLMVNHDLPVFIGVLAIILFSAFIGFANGFIIQKAKVDAFIVTLGMMLILEGIALVISPRPLGPSPSFFIKVFNGKLFGLPIAMVIMVLLISVFIIITGYTRLGRRFFAVGENAQKSFNAGINVDKTKYIAYIISSLMAGVAAIYVLGRFGGADPVLGPGMELSAIAAVLIGGATLAGGKGSVTGTVCGVFVLGILANIFSLLSIDVWYQHVLEGVVLIAIIAAYERAAGKKAKAV